jgi:UrcA family protein
VARHKEENLMKFHTLALAAAMAIGPAAAFAASPSVELRYDDLNLSTPDGMAKLNKRVEAAAREVCTSRHDTGSIVKQSLDRKCYQETLQKLQKQLALVTQQQPKG